VKESLPWLALLVLVVLTVSCAWIVTMRELARKNREIVKHLQDMNHQFAETGKAMVQLMEMMTGGGVTTESVNRIEVEAEDNVRS
jgi:hypothetical protein